MSGYKKNYTPWTKGSLNPSTYSGSSSSKIESSMKYGPVYSRSTPETKTSSERSSALRLGQKYGSYNSAHYCDGKDTDKYGGAAVTVRLKETDKREMSQPPVSYRSIARPTPRSRDPSMERDTTDRLASLTIHNCNTLYPPSIHTRSVSHDRSESTTSTSTIPKYTGRSSITKTDKFGLTRTSRNNSKEDLTATKYKPLSRATSREDLDIGPKKYITSRFLPKNTIEKSHTAYIRPSSTRISSSQRDTSRKNREILNLLSTQSDSSKTSRSASRSSNISEPTPSVTEKTSTSSNTKSTDVSKSEKLTSDNTSESTKSKISNVSATPWSSYLDLKFSSPKSSKNSSQNQSKQSSSTSKLSTTKSSSQSESKLKPIKSKSISSGKAILNKDFRKSVLNMNPEIKNGSVSPAESETEFPLSEATDVSENLSSCVSYHKQSSSASKLPKRSNSETRSARSNTRSPSVPSEGHSNATAVTSGSEDDLRTKSSSFKSELKQSKSFLASRSSLLNEHGDGSEKSPKPPMSPRQKMEKSENDTKPFFMRTLTPIAGGFKIKRHDSDHKINWMDSTDKEGSSASSKISKSVKEDSKSENVPKIKIMRRVDSGERAWWLDGNVTPPEGVEVYPDNNLDNSQEQDGSQKDYFKNYRIRHIDSGEKPWWMNSNENVSESTKSVKNEPKYKISHQSSGEKAWWLQTPTKSSDTSESDLEDGNDMPLGDRASPEGLEMPREEEEQVVYSKMKKPNSLFISKHKNIDDILGGASHCLSPLMEQIFNFRERKQNVEECQEVQPNQVKIHDSTPQHGVIRPNRLDNVGVISSSSSQADRLDDASLQLYKDGDYGSYLDLEASISEQHEEFDGFGLNKKNSIVLRTQLSVRVHSIIDKLLNSEGRELRRALFSLKQIFQEDKDLVHEFVQNDGLACLIKVGSEADQNYQNYILRALGQVMLYVDGMNGVIQHNETVQWLYNLISSKFRLVVKTALKLLLVFVEYVDSNCLLLIKAVQNADCLQGFLPWHNIMKLLKDFDSADTELLIYAMTLINKCFNGIPDQDTYYDQTDALEEQGIEGIIQRYMSKPGTDLDLLQQFQVYEAVLQYEDAEEKGIPLRNLDENLKKTLKSRKSVIGNERRKSRRHSTGNSPMHVSLNLRNNIVLQVNAEGDDESSSSQSSTGPNEVHLNGSYKENNKASEAGVTPALRRRRERAERQRSFMREQQETAASFREAVPKDTNNETLNGNYINSQHSKIPNGKMLNRTSSRKDITPLRNAVNKLDSDDSSLTKQPWILSMMYGNKTVDDENQENIEDTNENDRKMLMNRENTVKDLTQKLANQTIINNNFDENKINRIGDMSGLISKAKEGLAKSKSKIDVLKSPTNENLPKVEIKKSENELRWEELAKSLNRPLHLCDMDFTDLRSDDEIDVLAPAAASNGIPPPPPPLMGGILAPPPPPLNNNNINNKTTVPNPPVFGVNLQRVSKPVESKLPIKKNKKTVKLFWKEVRDDAITAMKLKTGLIWDELSPVNVDTQKLEHLFESRAKDLITKKQQELNKNKEIIVLDPKRSNAINIGMTKLPPPRSIKTAILKMDATVMNREGIEKLLTMLPTEEERTKIQEAQAANSDLPLGSAEQFLLTLASISELPARLNLWAFKLDFESSEREIAEPLMDLKQGFEVLKVNKTFRGILGTLLSIGIFLNGAEVKGFQIEYLAKVPEVKDTVHKHSLLHHLCHIVMEKFPDASDLYSEIGAITRASKVDFDELALNIQRLETDCKASWDHLKLIVKHDGSTTMKVKMSDFLADCAERIILLGIVHRRVMNRFHRFLLWLGIPLHQIADTKPNEFCRVISEFALEYRTTRERVLQQLEKKANHRERNKTRGKMITEIGKFRTKEDRADAELRQLLGSDMSDAENLQGAFTWRRRSRDTNRSFLSSGNGNLTDGDDEILESLVKTATKGPSRTAPRERKRTRHADRKSLKRSRTRENNPFGSRDSP